MTMLAGCGTEGYAGVTAAPASGVATPTTPAPAAPGTASSGEPVKSAVAARPVTTSGPAVQEKAGPTTTAPPAANPGRSAQPVRTTPVPLPTNDAARLRTLPASTKQVIIVQSGSQTSTSATLQAYARDGGSWTPVLGPMAARVGAKGFSDSKHEGDMTTPAGMFAIDATMYGISADPGVRYAYHRVVTDDWWNENSDTPGYNTFVHGPNPGGPSEALWTFVPQYNYFAVIRYNMPAAPGRGSGIFLHVASGNSTAGCVSLAQGDLLSVLRWLDPAANPQIVMAPTAWLGRY
ncbi:L,D-transpeptidase family protein [Dactylosporangium vinaceum]|nr:L,D-transpeptidase family protein [Dactylosporangium vinaceum]